VRTIIYGSRANGHANVVYELASADPKFELVGLVDDYPENFDRTVGGLRVLGTGDDLDALRTGGAQAILLGFGASCGRIAIVDRASRAGLELPPLIHSSSHICTSAAVGDAIQILALAYIGPNVTLRNGVLINTAAVIEHDVVVEAGSVVGPHATICGRVELGQEVTVGAGATILPDVKVGSRAVLGAGSLVREHVAVGTRVAGVPARKLA
jgi:sugar O-acyltransferase (sialic acid O-acetyltransferase NeuD family)